MIVRKFLLWARNAPARDRAEGTRMLARSWLAGQMGEAESREAETAFLSLTSDASPLVRLALAEELAASGRTPRSLVLALTSELGPAACAFFRSSPRLTDAELIDSAAMGGPEEQVAIASREVVPLELAAALAEVGCVEALLVLLSNPQAEIMPVSFARMLDRHGADGRLREALLTHDDLPPELRHEIALLIAGQLAGFAAGWLSPERAERITRDAADGVAITIAEEHGGDVAHDVATRLREKGRLTPALMLRALVFGRPALAEAAFADLSGLPMERVSSLLWQRRFAGFASLYRKAGLPEAFHGAFAAAVAAQAEFSQMTNDSARARSILSRVIAVCEEQGQTGGGLLALLRRFEADCARDEAQALADCLADEAALQLVIEADPTLLIEHFDDATAMRIARIAA
ncbi:MAG: DUF2336 domain-containing protein [Bosea sp. (in: a-proteobacteria)]